MFADTSGKARSEWFWSDKVGYVLAGKIGAETRYIENATDRVRAACPDTECRMMSMDVLQMTGNDHTDRPPTRWNWPR